MAVSPLSLRIGDTVIDAESGRLMTVNEIRILAAKQTATIVCAWMADGALQEWEFAPEELNHANQN